MSKIAPTSNIPCELAAGPVGFQDTVAMAMFGPDVIIFGRVSRPSPNAPDDVLAEIAGPEGELERVVSD